ncbi:hypothetical protein NM688_g5722 [Phlebia brevispora]|uniref:Uncharacterized protein n=1 Tax=Phlebia brevispora TaxID=194682 RepID=A0ACC1SR23_9APHY|nr:hypothetical protein NM688_g5722 [Phlebia brevispora]
MPLDGHAYLVSQGWEGRGSGLRRDAISRPIVLAQKKTLSGIGKDRDEAFPFWDHVFNAAATAIKIKVYDSDSDDSEPSSADGLNLQRTTTGLISNRRPLTGTPVISGTATPTSESSSSSGISTPKVSVMTAAKQAAAKRTLYSMFYRGPILSSEFEQEIIAGTATEEGDRKVEEAVVEVTEVLGEVEIKEKVEKKKRKRDEVEAADEDERKRRKREKKRAKDGTRSDEIKPQADGKKSKSGKTSSSRQSDDEMLDGSSTDQEAKKLAKAERKRLRAEKRARKEERRRRRVEKVAALNPVQPKQDIEIEEMVGTVPSKPADILNESVRSRSAKADKKTKHKSDEKKVKERRKRKA